MENKPTDWDGCAGSCWLHRDREASEHVGTGGWSIAQRFREFVCLFVFFSSFPVNGVVAGTTVGHSCGIKSLVKHANLGASAPQKPAWLSVAESLGSSQRWGGRVGGLLIHRYCGNSVTGLLCLRVSMRDRTPLFTLVETRRDTDSPGGNELQALWEGGRATKHFW